jgi:hypothetical protein
MLLVVDESNMSMEHRWSDCDRGKRKYSERNLPQASPYGIIARRSGTGGRRPPLPRVQTLPDLAQFLNVKKRRRKQSSNIFERRVVFFLAGMKAQWDEGGGTILLGDNTGSRAVLLRPIRFRCVGVRISTGQFVYACITDRMRTQFRLAPEFPARVCCVSRGVSVLRCSLAAVIRLMLHIHHQVTVMPRRTQSTWAEAESRIF